MTADTLYRAATLMRERAEAVRPSPWIQNGRNGIHTAVGQCIATTAAHSDDWRKAEAQHIASWHPAVALAVADWLDNEALVIDDMTSGNHTTAAYIGPAFEVALAYLGEDA